MAAAPDAGGTAGIATGLLEREARRRATGAGVAFGPGAAADPELRGRRGDVSAIRRNDLGAANSLPPRRCDAVHGAPGRILRTAPEVQRTRRHRGGNIH